MTEVNNIAGEIWKDVEGYEGRYQISNLGRLKSLKGNPKIIADKKVSGNSYHYALLTNAKGDKKNCLVHRLVAKAFPEICGEWLDRCYIDHIDTNHINNRADNLKVCKNQKENCNNPISMANYKKSNKGKRIKSKERHRYKVLQYDLNLNLIKVYDSISQVIEENPNFTHQMISSCCRHLSVTGYGFIWEYGDETTKKNRIS